MEELIIRAYTIKKSPDKSAAAVGFACRGIIRDLIMEFAGEKKDRYLYSGPWRGYRCAMPHSSSHVQFYCVVLVCKRVIRKEANCLRARARTSFGRAKKPGLTNISFFRTASRNRAESSGVDRFVNFDEHFALVVNSCAMCRRIDSELDPYRIKRRSYQIFTSFGAFCIFPKKMRRAETDRISNYTFNSIYIKHRSVARLYTSLKQLLSI